ncbi:hypothetical protein D3C76_693590 [compost metagenome]
MNAQRQPFNQCRFTDARLANQNRVVFTATGENIDHLTDFGITAKHRVNVALTRFGSDIEGEFIQRILQRRAEFTVFYLCPHRTSNHFNIAPALRQRCFLLNFRALVGLRINQRTQTLQLALAQRQQRPQAVTTHQFRFIDQRHQQMDAADLLLTVQGSNQPGLLHQGLNVVGQSRSPTHRARKIIQPAE